MTSDGHLVVVHDPCLKAITNIELYADLFADRLTESINFPLDDKTFTNDYFVNDFTLAELKQLRGI